MDAVIGTEDDAADDVGSFGTDVGTVTGNEEGSG